MMASKKAMIEARKARVPLSRVAIQLQRSDKRLRARVATVGALLLLGLTGAASLLVYNRPLEAFFATAPQPADEIETASASGAPSHQQVFASANAAPSTDSAQPIIVSGVEKPVQVTFEAPSAQMPAVKVEAPAQTDERPSQQTSVEPEAKAEVAETEAKAEIAEAEAKAEVTELGTPALQSDNAPLPTQSEETSPRVEDRTVVASVEADEDQLDRLMERSQASMQLPVAAPPIVASDPPVDPVRITAAAPVRDIVEILQPKEDTSCSSDLKELAEKATVYFPLSSVAVQPGDNASLKALVEAVKNCPTIRIDVGGHTDKTGEQLLNLQLSWQRAENVIKYLKLLGADTSKFSPVGFSATRPLYNEQTGLAQAKNRRVEFILR